MLVIKCWGWYPPTGIDSVIDLSGEVAKQRATKLPDLRPNYTKRLSSQDPKPGSPFVPFISGSTKSL